ncbi:Nitric oxide synthase, brain [Desmophyllum pertusum]|uniref:Nitric oxide synthase, brain n=1 Tax=Desmophyllum pertusum TaxID=174260 RepID=A0A9W9ZSU7_9CNID|nr:Nitric oxide synthase, brain [Desmophyllum pertusum]
MDDSSDGRITVNIAKRKLGGVGFLTNKRSICPYLAVSHVVKGGVAHETGLIQAGDVILEVNGKSLENVPYHKALEILDKVPTGEVMMIKYALKDSMRIWKQPSTTKVL